ncbi:hypothetical protein E4U54_006461, partial [Claviceps lovelessii]
MSQNAPRYGLSSSASDAYNSNLPPPIDVAAASGNRWDSSNRPYASSSSPTSPSSVISQQSTGSPTARLINLPLLSPTGPLPRPGQ